MRPYFTFRFTPVEKADRIKPVSRKPGKKARRSMKRSDRARLLVWMGEAAS